jgi:hypothetical protein
MHPLSTQEFVKSVICHALCWNHLEVHRIPGDRPTYLLPNGKSSLYKHVAITCVQIHHSIITKNYHDVYDLFSEVILLIGICVFERCGPITAHNTLVATMRDIKWKRTKKDMNFQDNLIQLIELANQCRDEACMHSARDAIRSLVKHAYRPR